MKDITIDRQLAQEARRILGTRDLVFVGLMGAGKTAIGKIVAAALDIPFVDSDKEIERISRMSITELFAAYGEEEFRALESRVIERLLKTGPRVVSTGGGAYINAHTRQLIKESDALTIWINADLETLWERVSRRSNRPLLKTENPKQTLTNLMNTRYPIYAEADFTILSRDVKKDQIATEALEAIVGDSAGTHMKDHENAG